MKLKTAFACVLLLLALQSMNAQTSHNITLTLNQPAQLSASAGADVVASAGNVVNIGGWPAAWGGTPPYTYSWSPVTGVSDPAASNPALTIGADGVYTLNVTDAYGCTTGSQITVTAITGITGTTADQFKVYPNPASRYLTIETTGKQATLLITDAKGSEVKSMLLTAAKTHLDVTGFSKGVYYLNLTATGKKQTLKIAIQ